MKGQENVLIGMIGAGFATGISFHAASLAQLLGAKGAWLGRVVRFAPAGATLAGLARFANGDGFRPNEKGASALCWIQNLTGLSWLSFHLMGKSAPRLYQGVQLATAIEYLHFSTKNESKIIPIAGLLTAIAGLVPTTVRPARVAHHLMGSVLYPAIIATWLIMEREN